MPTPIRVTPRTPAWHEWRRQGVGSSDAPVIMGVSPWRSARELWEEKLGLPTSRPVRPAMRRGDELKPRAIERYRERRGVALASACFEHSDMPWMRTSLDGWLSDESVVVEIKCPGAADHAIARSGRIPGHYYPQLQHQLAVTRATACHYVSFRDDELLVLGVRPNAEYIAQLVHEELRFWNSVRAGLPPGAGIQRA